MLKKLATITLGVLAALCVMGITTSIVKAAPPKPGSKFAAGMVCTTDAGTKVFNAAKMGKGKESPRLEWQKQSAANQCHAIMPSYVEAVSVLASHVDVDGDMMHMVDIGSGLVAFIWDKGPIKES